MEENQTQQSQNGPVESTTIVQINFEKPLELIKESSILPTFIAPPPPPKKDNK